MWSLRHELGKQPMRAGTSSNASEREFGDVDEATRAQLANVADRTADLVEVQAQIFAERLGVEQAKLMEALDIYGQTIQSRLNLASVTLAREFRDSGEQLSRRVEAAGEAAVTTIARQGETVTSTIGMAAAQVEQRLGERSHEFVAQMDLAGASIADAIVGMSEAAAERIARSLRDLSERSLAEMERRLEESEARQRSAAAAAAAGAQALDERAAAATAKLESKLQSATLALEQMVDAALQRIEAKIEARVEQLGERLAEVDSELERQWSGRRNELAAEFLTVAGEARSAVMTAAAEVGARTQEVAGAAHRAFAESAELSMAKWTELAGQAAQRLTSAADRTREALSAGEASMIDRLHSFETAVAERAAKAAQQMDFQSRSLGDALAGLQDLLTRQGGTLTQSIAESATKLDETLASRLQEAEARMDGWRLNWEEGFASHVRLLEDSTRGGVASLHALATEQGDAAAALLRDHHASVAAGFASAMASLQAELGAREQQAATGLAGVAQAMTDRLVRELGGLAATLVVRSDEVRDQIVARHDELKEIVEQVAARTETSLAGRLAMAAQAVNRLAEDAGGELDRRSQALAASLAQATQQHVTALESGVATATGAFESSRLRLGELIAGGIAGSAAAMSASFEANLRQAEGRMRAAAELLDASQRSSAQSAVQVLTEAQNALEAGSRQAEQTIEKGRDRLLAALAEAAQAGAADLAKGAEQRQRAINVEAAQAVERIEVSRASIADAANRLSEELARHVGELQVALTETTQKLKLGLTDPLSETLARIENEGAEVAGATRVLTETLVSSSAEHRDRLHQAFAREADALAATVAANAEAFQRNFETAIASADTVFLSRGLGLAQELAARVNELRALFESDGMPMLKALDERSSALSKQIDATSQRALSDFERKATGLIGLLTRRGDDLLSSMTAAASEPVRRVAQLASDVDRGVAQAETALREMERKVGAMLTVIDRRGAELAAGEGSAQSGVDYRPVPASPEVRPPPPPQD